LIYKYYLKTERGSVGDGRVTRSPLDVKVLIKRLIVINLFVDLCMSVINVYDSAFGLKTIINKNAVAIETYKRVRMEKVKQIFYGNIIAWSINQGNVKPYCTIKIYIILTG